MQNAIYNIGGEHTIDLNFAIEQADVSEFAITTIKAALEAKDEPVGTAGELFSNTALERLDLRPSTGIYITPPQRKPLSDEEIQEIVSDASRAGTLSWTGYKEDDEGKYTIPVLSLSDYQFARAIEAAHGIKEEK